MTASVELPARLDTAAAPGLAAEILARAGEALQLDATNVSQLGGLCLQVLLSAAGEWRGAGKALSIDPRSANFDLALTTFGIQPADLTVEGAQ